MPALLELDTVLRDIEPPVWRRVRVPATATLGDLHRVLQLLFGWQNRHLHQFTAFDGRPYVDRAVDPDAPEEAVDERDIALLEVLPAVGDRLQYEYDFGDEWEVEVIRRDDAAAEREARPRVVEGARAGPPEGCGGPFEYDELVAALADPAHLEHEELRDWVPPGFDPERFDPAALQAALERLF